MSDGTVTDSSQWTGPFQAEFIAYVAETALPLQIAVTETGASTAELTCAQVADDGTDDSGSASAVSLSAVQVSALH